MDEQHRNSFSLGKDITLRNQEGQTLIGCQTWRALAEEIRENATHSVLITTSQRKRLVQLAQCADLEAMNAGEKG